MPDGTCRSGIYRFQAVKNSQRCSFFGKRPNRLQPFDFTQFPIPDGLARSAESCGKTRLFAGFR
ncbi:hypothetical protein DEM27_09015 [Metarhizobium album]|uniref:Uncharacterized protein n=1 Tax=Metarhizobium album TaxID=2182425 RepID=A0A2U2DT89_9HYPH|nr:hypothetical protein DEM27_09015 [Rhizobium album]